MEAEEVIDLDTSCQEEADNGDPPCPHEETSVVSKEQTLLHWGLMSPPPLRREPNNGTSRWTVAAPPPSASVQSDDQQQ